MAEDDAAVSLVQKASRWRALLPVRMSPGTEGHLFSTEGMVIRRDHMRSRLGIVETFPWEIGLTTLGTVIINACVNGRLDTSIECLIGTDGVARPEGPALRS